MRLFILTFSTLLLFFVISCSSDEDLIAERPIFIDSLPQSSNFMEIEPETSFRRSSKLDSLIDTTNILFIDTNDSMLLSNIDDIEFFEDRYYILDTKLSQIVVIDTTGKNIYTIQDRGKSRKEYLKLSAFELDTTKRVMYVLDGNGGKILRYDIEGNYQKSIMLPRRSARNFAHMGKEVFVFEFGCKGSSNDANGNSNIMIYDSKQDSVLASHFQFREGDISYYTFWQTMFSRYNDKTYYWTQNGKKLYEFDRDGKAYEKINFNLNGEEMPFSLFRQTWKKYYKIFNKNQFVYLNRFFEFENFYYYTIYNKWTPYHHFYNKKTKEVLRCSSRYGFGEFPNVLQNNMFKISEDRMCTYMSAEWYLRYNKLDSIVKIDDNPVLLLYTFKKNPTW